VTVGRHLSLLSKPGPAAHRPTRVYCCGTVFSLSCRVVSRQWPPNNCYRHIHQHSANRFTWMPHLTKGILTTSPFETRMSTVASTPPINTSMWLECHPFCTVWFYFSLNHSDVLPSPFPHSFLALHNNQHEQQLVMAHDKMA
jgi:hypothetical protein